MLPRFSHGLRRGLLSIAPAGLGFVAALRRFGKSVIQSGIATTKSSAPFRGFYAPALLPRLAPWATFYRPCGAGIRRGPATIWKECNTEWHCHNQIFRPVPGLLCSRASPTACAVGYFLSPLRGWDSSRPCDDLERV